MGQKKSVKPSGHCIDALSESTHSEAFEADQHRKWLIEVEEARKEMAEPPCPARCGDA